MELSYYISFGIIAWIFYNIIQKYRGKKQDTLDYLISFIMMVGPVGLMIFILSEGDTSIPPVITGQPDF